MMRAPGLFARHWSACSPGRTAIFCARANTPITLMLRQSRRPFSSNLARARIFFRKPPPPFRSGRALIATAAVLSPAAFIELSEEDRHDGKTGEEHMLEASRRELDESVPEVLRNSKKVRRSIWYFLDTWIWEPIATGIRFAHLVFIFVPVIVTVPAIWFGARQKDRDNERSGTLWWYGFLVWSMERAGAAFIKVCGTIPGL